MGKERRRGRGSLLTNFFHHDGITSVTAVTNDKGATVQRFRYDAWGKRTNPDNGSAITWATNAGMTRGFTDHEQLDDQADNEIHVNPGLARVDVRELREGTWEAALAKGLRALGKNSADLVTKPKGPSWKIALAQRVREESGASLSWLAAALRIGRPETLRSYLYRQRLTTTPFTTA